MVVGDVVVGVEDVAAGDGVVVEAGVVVVVAVVEEVGGGIK